MSDTQPNNTQDLMRFENEKKSLGAVLFFCWILGAYGAHRFYLKQPHAKTMLIITLVSLPLCFVIIGFAGLFAMIIWQIIDLFSVSKWVKEHDTVLLARIQSGQG